MTLTISTADIISKASPQRVDATGCLPLAGYARISQDQYDEHGALMGRGVTRQRDDYQRISEQRGFTVGRNYEDNNLSAWDRKVRRPDFERMVEDLTAGMWGGIAAYDLDRLVRQPKDLETLIGVYEEVPGLAFVMVTNEIDLSTADGRTHARLLVTFANKSSDDMSRRLKRVAAETVKAGRVSGGAKPFGWKADSITAHPDFAPLVRTASEMYVSGASCAEVSRYLFSEGAGRRDRKDGTLRLWNSAQIRKMLINPRLAGIRCYDGKIVTGELGVPIRGEWEPILTDAEWQANVDRATGDKRAPHRPATRYLLGGIARCGKCMAKMRGQISTVKRLDGRVVTFVDYRCPGAPEKACGGVGRKAAPVDDLVIRAALDTMAARKTPIVEKVSTDWPGQVRFDELVAEATVAKERYDAKRISVGVYLDIVETVETEQALLLEDRARHGTPVREVLMTAEDGLDRFDEMTLNQQRELILRYFRAVIVLPVGKGKRFDPASVKMIPVASTS